MPDPLNQRHVSLMMKLQRKRRFAWCALMLERAGAAFWRSAAWAAFFCGLWMLDLPDMFGKAGGGLALIVFLLGLLFFLRRDLPALRAPAEPEVDRRMEQAGAIGHRPLSTLEDRLANPGKAHTAKLWQDYKENALDRIRGLKTPIPRPLLTRADPRALRILAFLTAFIGFAVAGPQWDSRIRHGLFPFSIDATGAADGAVSVLITPPAYTGLKAFAVQGGKTEKPVALPAGSRVKAIVSDGWARPRLSMGGESLPFRKLDGGGWGIETALKEGDRIVVRQMLARRADIPYVWTPDRPPEIAVKGDPKVLEKGAWQFDMTTRDDYGVTALILHMKLAPEVASAPYGNPVDDARPVLTGPNVETAMKPVYDMTWHTWAGLPVIVTLEAKDHMGQTAETPPMKLTLPERPFRHPVAAEIVGLRKRLAWTPEASALNVSYDLERILQNVPSYQGDTAVFLSLRSASSRLRYDPTVEGAISLLPQLWDTAIRIEDGNVALAARAFRNAQQDLQNLLNDPDATPDQIAAAMEKLREAVANYMNESFREVQKRMAESGMPPLSPQDMAKLVRPEDIESFLDQLQAQALTGDKDAARRMLSQLDKLAEMMDPSAPRELPPDVKFMADALKRLEDITKKQEELAKKTGEKKNGGNCEGDKAEQESLIAELEQLMLDSDNALGKIPPNMQDADLSMRDAADALGRSQPQEAAPSQQQALDHLRKGQQDMAGQMRERLKQMMMTAFSAGGTDPLGRPREGGNGSSFFSDPSVKIPDESERRKVQDIMRTLRQRSGELDRPDYELEYYRRLMRQF